MSPRTFFAPAIGLLLLLLPACLESRGVRAQERTTADRPARAYANPFEPQRLIVHPLTRLYRDEDTGDLRVEAHLQLFDEWGDGVKALGTVVLELYRENAPGAGGGSEQVRLWPKDLTDPAENSRAYDRVTRTYRLTLTDAPAPGELGSPLALVAQFTTIDGKVLTAPRHRFSQ